MSSSDTSRTDHVFFSAWGSMFANQASFIGTRVLGTFDKNT